MKKVTIFSTLAMLLLITGTTSCLKDKDFEDQKYGTQIAEVKAVAFPEASSSPVLSAISSQTTPSVVQGPFITLEENGNASSNITVTLQEVSSLVVDEGYTPLPAGTYSISTLTPVIASGQKMTDAVKITIPNSTVLDPTKIYGVGLTISSVDQGYKIAANQKNVVIAFSIKNKYDGVYKLKMKMSGWAAYDIADGVSDTYPANIHLLTASANSVTLYNEGRKDDLQPGFTGGVGFIDGATAFGAATPEYVFDNATNKLIDVVNTTPDDGRGRGFFLNPAVTDSRFDPATRTIYAAYFMKQNGRPNMAIYDTLTFIKER